MATRLVNGTPRNYPTKPQVPVAKGLTYPSDLFAPTDGGAANKFYTSIHIKTASLLTGLPPPFGLSTGGVPTGPSSGINLPIPRKINDVEVLTWSQESTTALAASLGVNLLNFVAGAAGAGVIINPYLFLLFKHPNFKSIEMSWTFVADNAQESDTISKIVDALKYHASPTAVGPFMRYPDVFYVRLNPEPKFTFRIKPCIIEAVAVDYSGGEVPAFYKNGAPVAVNLTIRFKEIEIWEKGTWNRNTL